MSSRESPISMPPAGGDLVSDELSNSFASVTLFLVLLSACAVIIQLIEGRRRRINTSIIPLLFGLCSGGLLLVATGGVYSRVLEFNEPLFFIYLLPPIIFNAGFRVQRKHFFNNLVAISLLGVVGTVISFVLIAFGTKLAFKALDIRCYRLQDYLAIGAIFSATDSVGTQQVLDQDEMPSLYSIVFGEGVVNNAAVVVLFKAIQKFDCSNINSTVAFKFIGISFSLFMWSMVLGVSLGLLCAFIIKKMQTIRLSINHEAGLILVMAYLSYGMAELFNSSGILTVFFCGIVLSHYTWSNVDKWSRLVTVKAFSIMSFVAETFIFLYVGMDVLDIDKWKIFVKSPATPVIATAILLCLVAVGRAVSVFTMSFLLNLVKKDETGTLDSRQQVTIWWVGLIRGAVSMALAYSQFAHFEKTQNCENAAMITCTIIIVIFTTVVLGLLTKHVIRRLLPESNYSNILEDSTLTSMTLPLLMSDAMNVDDGGRNMGRSVSIWNRLTTRNHAIHYYWEKFDNAFMQPAFGGRRFDEESQDEDDDN